MCDCSANFTLITLDLDETVWPSEEVLRRAEEIQYKWLQQQAARLTATHNLESLRAHRRIIREHYPEIAHDLTAARLTSLRLLLEELDYPRELAEAAVAVFLKARNWVTPYADVVPVLERLAQTYCLASLTNGNADVTLHFAKAPFSFFLYSVYSRDSKARSGHVSAGAGASRRQTSSGGPCGRSSGMRCQSRATSRHASHLDQPGRNSLAGQPAASGCYNQGFP